MFVVDLAYSVTWVARYFAFDTRTDYPPSIPAITLILNIDMTVNAAREESGSP